MSASDSKLGSFHLWNNRRNCFEKCSPPIFELVAISLKAIRKISASIDCSFPDQDEVGFVPAVDDLPDPGLWPASKGQRQDPEHHRSRRISRKCLTSNFY